MLIKILNKMKRIKTKLLFCFLFFLTIASIKAMCTDVMIAQQCEAHILHLEQTHQIPSGLLFAIAKTESGRKLTHLNKSVPWPWAVNAQGKPMYFQTKMEAVAAVNRLIKKGIRNIDIGCMQINYHHHGHHFRSVLQMFDPHTNIEYGARFLANLKSEHGSWTKAVGLYHSATLKYQIPYKKKVYQQWQQHQLANSSNYGDSPQLTQYHQSYTPADAPHKNPPLFFMVHDTSRSRIRTYYSHAHKELAKLRQQREHLQEVNASARSTQTAAKPQFFEEVKQPS